MKILQVNNFYQTRGGEHSVVALENKLLQAKGHQVELFAVTNDWSGGFWKKCHTALLLPYSQNAKQKILKKIWLVNPDIVHVHNYFPILTPAVFYACQEARIPVVHTLHNYRLMCPGTLLMRDNRVCEDCMHGSAYGAAIHGCYRGSIPGTLAVARLVQVHRKQQTWQKKIDHYIALTDFARNKFIEAGLPSDKISVKPNFIFPDPGQGDGTGEYALFVGRLSEEKGIDILLAAWQALNTKITLKIVGAGPLSSSVKTKSAALPNIEILGFRPQTEVVSLMKRASFLVFPSICYEGFPVTLAEAFATGLPVVASNLGAMASIIQHGHTGLLFRSGDFQDLLQKVKWLLNHPDRHYKMRDRARHEFESRYTADSNYRLLMNAYDRAATK